MNTVTEWKNFYRATIKPECYANALEALQQAKQRPTRYADIDTCIAAVKQLIAERGKK